MSCPDPSHKNGERCPYEIYTVEYDEREYQEALMNDLLSGEYIVQMPPKSTIKCKLVITREDKNAER